MKSIQLVIFTLGNELFGADIQEVNEIIRMPQITKLPNMPSEVEGITNLRGKLCTVVNLKEKFKMAGGLSEEAQIVVVNDSMAGFIVDSVKGIVTVEEEKIQALDTIFLGTSITSLSNIAKVDDDIIAILNIKELTRSIQSQGSDIEELRYAN